MIIKKSRNWFGILKFERLLAGRLHCLPMALNTPLDLASLFTEGGYKQVEEFIAEEMNSRNEVEIVTTIEATESPFTTTAPNPIPAANCNRTSYTFNKKSHKDYVQYVGSIPPLNSFTACAWVSPAPNELKISGSLFNYCVGDTEHCNTILVLFQSTGILVMIQKKTVLPNQELIRSRSHFCIVKSMADKRVRYYINGTERDSKYNNDHILGGGILILGQDQDRKPSGNNPGLINDDDQGFTGIIQDFYLWNRALNQTEILSIKQANCSCPDDVTISFDSGNSSMRGHVTSNTTVKC